MADTTDMAPNTPPPARSGSTRSRAGARGGAGSANLEAQISRLQSDLKGIADTLAKLSEQKVGEVQGAAREQVRNLVAEGQQRFGEIQDEFGHMEKQVKDVIRQKPLTSVLGAAAIGFVIALIIR
jgi:ElaB/YqjD/DUF883 family membrane-anchored ribosome-binding protein